MSTCNYCKNEVDDDSLACPKCGRAINSPRAFSPSPKDGKNISSKNLASQFFRILTIDRNFKHIVIDIGYVLLVTILGFVAFTVTASFSIQKGWGAESIILTLLFEILPLTLLFFGGSAYYLTAKSFLQNEDLKLRRRHFWQSIGSGVLSAIILTVVFHLLVSGLDFETIIDYWNKNHLLFLNEISIDSDSLKFILAEAVWFIVYTVVAVKSWYVISNRN